MRKPASIRAFPATVATCACAALLFAGGAEAASSGGVGPGGGAPAPEVAGPKAKLTNDGFAVAPAGAPKAVKRAIAAANSIDDAGYCSGGGHKGSNCYDCSGAVSYVLGPKGANVLKAPLPSGSFRSWGEAKRGSWITVYYNGGHAFVEIAGLRFDTSIPDDGQEGPGWSKDVKAGLVNGPFKKRHPLGL